jgi:hypothetical protein
MSERPSATLLGTVKKIMESPSACKPTEPDPHREGANRPYQEIRIENTPIDENS